MIDLSIEKGDLVSVRITKFNHSCLLVEVPERTVLFDPGVFSEPALATAKLNYLDDIFITHEHGDHFSPELVEQLVGKFPDVRITAPPSVVEQLSEMNIIANDQPPKGAALFDAPHEKLLPGSPVPQEIGIHYLDVLSHPGDSHSFTETKAILALPITAPWGSTVAAANLALALKPRFILPIHDWLWRDSFRISQYESLEKLFAAADITFLKLETGIAVTLEA